MKGMEHWATSIEKRFSKRAWVQGPISAGLYVLSFIQYTVKGECAYIRECR